MAAGAGARWAELLTPQPRARQGDTDQVPPLPARDPVPVDVHDPAPVASATSTRPGWTPPARTATAWPWPATGPITMKMMVDADLGARLSTMFMARYGPQGVAGPTTTRSRGLPGPRGRG
jgi:hypothetical protein